LAGLLGLIVAAAVTTGLVRPVRRLLAGTAAVEQGALDTVVPGHLARRDRPLNRVLQQHGDRIARSRPQIRGAFGKYVDRGSSAGLIDRPELADPRRLAP